MKQLTQEQEEMLGAFLQIQQTNLEIDMLSGQYAMASMQKDRRKKQKCADLMVERAKLLLEASEQLAKMVQ